MEDSLTKQIETSTDVHLQMTKNIVDHYITYFQQKYDQDKRNAAVMTVFRLVQKKHIGANDTKFIANPRSIIGVIANSYLIGQIDKEKKNLEKPD